LVETGWHEPLWSAIARLAWRWSCWETARWGSERCAGGWWRSHLHWWWNSLEISVGLREASRSHGSLRRHTAKHRWRTNRNGGRGRLNTVGLCLSSKQSFSRVTVPLTLSVLLIRVLDGYLLIHQVLTVHVCNGVIRGFKVGE
jgi:hypothetical protein